MHPQNGAAHGLRGVAVVVTSVLAFSACSSSSGGGGKPTATGSSSAPSSIAPRSQGPTAPASTSGSPTLKAVFTTTKVATGHATIAFTKQFVQALYTRGIRTSTATPATLDTTHRLQLPVAGGSARLYAGRTSLTHNSADLTLKGGLNESRSGTSVTVRQLVMSIGPKATVSARLATDSDATSTTVTLFDLTLSGGATGSSDSANLGGMRATVDPAAGRELDSALHTTAFSDFGSKTAGIVSISVGT